MVLTHSLWFQIRVPRQMEFTKIARSAAGAHPFLLGDVTCSAFSFSDRSTISVTAKPELGFSPKAYVERVNPMSQRLCEVLRHHKESLTHAGPRDPVFQKGWGPPDRAAHPE